jgi:hypothetical protein
MKEILVGAVGIEPLPWRMKGNGADRRKRISAVVVVLKTVRF